MGSRELSAEEIRLYVQRQYMELARRRGENEVTIRAGDIHDEMNLSGHQPLVCDTLRGRKLQKQCNIRLINERRGRNVHQRHAKNIWYIYEMLQPLSRKTVTKKTIMRRTKVIDIEERKHWNILARKKREFLGPKGFEELAREVLSKHYRAPLTEGKVEGIPKIFDMVDLDGEIVGDAKYLTMVRGERIPPAKFSMISEYVWLLEKVSAIHKFLVFGNDHRVPIEWLKRYGHLVADVVFFFLNTQTGELERLN